MTERWPNQVLALERTTAAIAGGGKRICVTSPTGSGKTRCMTDLIEWAAAEPLPAALYTQRRMLFDQTCSVLDRVGIHYGRRASGHETALLRDVQVCMLQTEASQALQRQARPLHRAGVVLFDEAHCNTGETVRRIMDEHIASDGACVGYTATPLGIGHLYEELICAARMSDCFRVGSLVPAETYAPDEPDLRHIRKYCIGDDLSETDNRKAVMRPGIFARVITAWQAHNPEQRPTVLFAPGVRESIWFAEQFCAAGIRAAHIDGNDVWLDGEYHASDQARRQEIVALLRDGAVKVLCNRFVLREGIDLPFVGCLIFATVFGSLTSYLQAGGRGLRAFSGKDRCIVIDHGGSWWRHGSLNADRQWSLELNDRIVCGERMESLREKREPEPIVCPNCGKVRSQGRECPVCGHVAHRKSRCVVQIDGTLRPVQGDILRPRRVRIEADTAELWQSMYYRMRRAGKTFRQAEAYFCHLHHYWPPRNMPLMPTRAIDWYQPIADVPSEALQ